MRTAVAWAPALPVLFVCGCLAWAPAPVPMRTVAWRQPAGATRARCLVVFLPGRGDDADDFERNGLVADLTQRHLSVDMVAADASIGYYMHGTFLERLASDVMGPAHVHSYQQV